MTPVLLVKLMPAIIAIAAAGASFYAGFKYSAALESAAKAQLIIDNQELLATEASRRHEISMEYEKKLQAAKEKSRVVYRTIEKEIEKPVYKECVVPTTGVKILTDKAEELNRARVDKKINDKASTLNSKRTQNNESK